MEQFALFFSKAASMKLDFYVTHSNFPNTVGQPEWNSGYCPRGIAEGRANRAGTIQLNPRDVVQNSRS